MARPRITIKIKNLDKVAAIATKFPAIARRHIDNAIVRSIGEIETKTKPFTPVKTGRLRNDLQARFAPFQGTFGSRLPYAVKVHDLHPPGTPYRSPSLNKRAIAGFLTEGVRKSEPLINREFVLALQRITDDLVK